MLPNAVKNPIKKAIGKAVELGEKGVSATAGRVANTLVTTRCRAAAQLALLGSCIKPRFMSEVCSL